MTLKQIILFKVGECDQARRYFLKHWYRRTERSLNRRSEGDEDKDEDDVEDRLARWRSLAHAEREGYFREDRKGSDEGCMDL